jgi:hypothetical protein
MKNYKNKLFIKFISNPKNQFLINQIPEDKRQEIIKSIEELYNSLENNNIISENKIEK